MTNVIRDNNHIPSILALSYVDGTTLVPIKIDSSNGGIEIDISNNVSTAAMDAARDGNHVPTLMGVDSVSGNPIPIFADPTTGSILVDIT
jgi:hypothetical protein|tara:strand:+ start:507 stop:776 length:270 start_codon:yes stop_codon:yes gene_type:complete